MPFECFGFLSRFKKPDSGIFDPFFFKMCKSIGLSNTYKYCQRSWKSPTWQKDGPPQGSPSFLAGSGGFALAVVSRQRENFSAHTKENFG